MFGNPATGDEAHKYVTIEKAAKDYPVSKLCTLFKVSRSGYYAFLKRRGTDRDRDAKALVKKVYEQYNGVYGYRQVQLFLQHDHGVWMNHKKVLRLMQVLGIRSQIRRKHRCNYASCTAGRAARNLLKRDFKADKPNQKWVTDITQYRVGDRWLYLSVIKDLFNNEIIAYQMSHRNDNELVLQTFQQAWEQRRDVAGLIVHSGQRLQYTSHPYHDMLPRVGAQISMSRRGSCYDNASMESFFSHLKTEGLYPYDIRNMDEAQRRIEKYIRFYNQFDHNEN
ncbi:IS3 family transposase [Paenibacillus sp. CMAA1739]|uniref:IS3 family transposase n=1 Tax=Paenibacillus ottowii TaxID=2315729 RepID=UPI002DBA10CC|nr:IS3 family transposase [Paenibacillus sp. CMAA1739]MEC4565759.1 IS3 family transposase [Paenibacillus sp. CMAA1739]